MKEIVFIRHAKSDWGSEFLKDVDRPLAERGYRDAYTMCEWYRLNKPVPDLIVSSPAARAANTALMFMRHLGLTTQSFAFDDRIYEAPADRLLLVVRSLPESASRVMIFGHNPGFTNLSNVLGENVFFDNVPTCGIVAFDARVSKWKDVEPKKAALQYYQFPKDFRQRL